MMGIQIIEDRLSGLDEPGKRLKARIPKGVLYRKAKRAP
jgi:hypothetical protein